MHINVVVEWRPADQEVRACIKPGVKLTGTELSTQISTGHDGTWSEGKIGAPGDGGVIIDAPVKTNPWHSWIVIRRCEGRRITAQSDDKITGILIVAKPRSDRKAACQMTVMGEQERTRRQLTCECKLTVRGIKAHGDAQLDISQSLIEGGVWRHGCLCQTNRIK